MDDIAVTKYLESLMTHFLETQAGEYHHQTPREHQVPQHHYQQEADAIAGKMDFGLSFGA